MKVTGGYVAAGRKAPIDWWRWEGVSIAASREQAVCTLSLAHSRRRKERNTHLQYQGAAGVKGSNSNRTALSRTPRSTLKRGYVDWVHTCMLGTRIPQHPLSHQPEVRALTHIPLPCTQHNAGALSLQRHRASNPYPCPTGKLCSSLGNLQSTWRLSPSHTRRTSCCGSSSSTRRQVLSYLGADASSCVSRAHRTKVMGHDSAHGLQQSSWWCLAAKTAKAGHYGSCSGNNCVAREAVGKQAAVWGR